MTRMDSTRIGKNFGHRPVEEYCTAANAVLEHHFDNHEFCGPWCRRKNETEEQCKGNGKYYRCKIESPKLYVLLEDKLARFVTLDRLIEMAHGLDSNMNEAFNQICKNKIFAGSGSLNNRISFAVSINSIGLEDFFLRLFKKLGIAVSDNVSHFLMLKEKYRRADLPTFEPRNIRSTRTNASKISSSATQPLQRSSAIKELAPPTAKE
jgi:hypothetical protein